jgi:3-phenylpropionate/trans-cinnamate dioxygenase ferredoxin reductase subunit
MTLRRVVVVGAGVGGLTTARTLRDAGFDGEIVLVGDEQTIPYARPPLSKHALTTGPAIDDVALLAPADLALLAVDFRPGTHGQPRSIWARAPSPPPVAKRSISTPP